MYPAFTLLQFAFGFSLSLLNQPCTVCFLALVTSKWQRCSVLASSLEYNESKLNSLLMPITNSLDIHQITYVQFHFGFDFPSLLNLCLKFPRSRLKISEHMFILS